jgi:hypothetical protein
MKKPQACSGKSYHRGTALVIACAHYFGHLERGA